VKGFYRISGLMTGRRTFLRSVSYAEMPQKFLKALARLPECGGIALGMDRLM
jgi:elongation factor P--beta-lysine ligase